MSLRRYLLLVILIVGCGEKGPAPTPSGELVARSFQTVEQARTNTDGFTLASLDDGVAVIRVESTLSGMPEADKHPFGSVKVSLADNSAKAGNVACRVHDPQQMGLNNGPMQWVVEISCDYKTAKTEGSDIRARLLEDGKLLPPGR